MSQAAEAPATVAPAAPAKYGITLAATFLSALVAQAANAMPGALLGTFQSNFHTVGSQLTWITAAFMIPLTVFELTFGLLGDLVGRRRLLFAGTLLTVVGGIVAAAASNVYVLWTGSALLGFGGGILFPTSLAMIAAIAPDPRRRTRLIATWAGFLSLGAAVSPMLAGITAQYGTWRIAYGVIAAGAVVIALLNTGAAESRSEARRRFDIPGQITLAVGLIALLYATVQGSEDGWAQTYVIIAFIVGAGFIAAFVVAELRSASPLIHLSVFRNRSFAIAAIVAVVGMYSFLSYCYSMNMWNSALQGQAPVRSGILMLFVQVPAFALIPVVSALIHRFSPQWILTTGFVLMAVGSFIASSSRIQTVDWKLFILPSLLVGIGFALTIGSITAVAINSVPLEQAGMASATTNLLRDLGFALGPVLGGAIALSDAGSKFGGSFAGIARSAHLPAPMAAQFAHVPPIAFLSTPSLQHAITGAAGQRGLGAVTGAALGALGHGFGTAFIVAGSCALAAALLTLAGLAHAKPSVQVETEI